MLVLPIRVGVAPWPHMHAECFPSRKTGCPAGPELDILEMLAHLTKLDIHLVVDDSQPGCGYVSQNGTYYGLLGALQRGEIDMIGNLCNLNRFVNRDQYVFDISWPIWQFQEQFVIQVLKKPPQTFAPLAPFTTNVWLVLLAVLLLFVGALTVHSVVIRRTLVNIYENVLAACWSLGASIFAFITQMPAQRLWVLWVLLLTAAMIFYETYILSAILHPYPLNRPFGTTDQYVEALSSGKYRVLSYTNPATVPEGCGISELCRQKFKDAIEKNGFVCVPASHATDVWKTLAEQDIDEDVPLVHAQGAPFIAMYLSKYVEKRDRLWLIDEGYEKWGGLVWRKNFSRGEILNRQINMIGDFKQYVLKKYSLAQGGPAPKTGRYIVRKANKWRQITVVQVQNVFVMLIGGFAAGCAAFAFEVGRARAQRKMMYVSEVICRVHQTFVGDNVYDRCETRL